METCIIHRNHFVNTDTFVQHCITQVESLNQAHTFSFRFTNGTSSGSYSVKEFKSPLFKHINGIESVTIYWIAVQKQ